MEREIVGVIWLALSVAIVFAIDNAARHEREQCEKHANTQLINDVLAHDRARRQREEEKMSVKNLGKPSKDDAIGFVPKDTYDKLEAENEKLRELVQYILDENYGDDWFYEKAEELGLEARY